MDNDRLDGNEEGNDPLDDNEGELGRADRIVEILKTEIKVGKLREGEKLPPERELADRFKVSRMTVRGALQSLVGEGLVVSRPGLGYFVTGIRKRLQEYHGEEIHAEPETQMVRVEEVRVSSSFFTNVERLGLKPKVKFLEQPALVAANTEIAEHLQLPVGTLVLKRYRMHSADKQHYRIIESYYPSDLFGELLTTDIGSKPLFTWLKERHGLVVAHEKEILIARLATTPERRLLRLSRGAPVVAFDRTVWADSGRPVEWAHIIASAELYTFVYDYNIPT